MNSKQFQDATREAFLKYFPNGYIGISKLSIGGGCGIFCGLIGDINDVGGKIRMNDPMTVRAFIHDNFSFNDETTDLENVVIEFDGSWISVLPDNPHNYCQSHKVPSRKINAEPSKALINLDKYFKRLKDSVTEQAGLNRIIQQEKIPAKYL
ncbi:hypothetical protein pEaSNUABM49_00006 [Erwinia phage pEa_SNUABM_49]|nr:hypothetical protein pEaSNUABM44_00005 [Erwinia phage pEa_SNUABM_44]QXO12252.1 hypothetical protein pEaSNUABM49_00006 [Erwinia phage pEa_SNUABM_49]